MPVESPGIYSVTVGLAGALRGGGEWAREATRTIVAGEGVVPWRGNITWVEGGYVTINRGSRHGIREGIGLTFNPGSSTVGTSIVVSAEIDSSTVEVQELWGSAVPEPGMTTELDRAQCMTENRW